MRLPECDNDLKFMYSQVLGHYKNNLNVFWSRGMLGSRNSSNAFLNMGVCINFYLLIVFGY